MEGYQQPIKDFVRNRVLRHAVRALTVDRQSSTVVIPDELRAVVAYAIEVLAHMGYGTSGKAIRAELDNWIEMQATRVQTRHPDQLRVVYLCGAEPLNDLKVLLQLGVNPHNVWAVESNEGAYRGALAALDVDGTPVKIHRGPLHSFFEQVEERFDIAYLDTTGPILGGRPSALSPVIELLRASRLEPLSALITNFAEVPSNEVDRYSDVMTEFFRFRYNDVPTALTADGVDPAEAEHDRVHMRTSVIKHVEDVYSDFISRLLIDLGRNWVPSARGMRILGEQYLSDKATRIDALNIAFSPGRPSATFEETFKSIGDIRLSPSSYPLISFVQGLRELAPNDALVQKLIDIKFSGRDAFELNKAVSLLDKIAEGHWRIASQELLLAIAQPWFDGDSPFSCDLPFPNLMVHSLLGVYGQPVMPSLRNSLRGKYIAKATTMFTDLLIMDRCRYYFDWFPTAAQVPSRFRSTAVQVIARCVMDRIWSSDRSPDAHPFRGSSVAGFYALKDAPFHGLKEREIWTYP